jgi:DNA-binding response OmpR family regulator
VAGAGKRYDFVALEVKPAGTTAGDDQMTGQERKRSVSSRILVVDHEPTVRALVAEILVDEGYEVIQATNGVEAFQMVDDMVDLPRLVILDPWHAEKASVQFARYLRDRGIPVPIVVLSSTNQAHPSIAAVGSAGFLAKPFEIGELIRVVGQYAGTVA